MTMDVEVAGRDDTPRPPRLPFHALGEEDAREPDALVERMLWPGAKHLLVSPPKAGKSFLAIAMCAALAEGRAFLGRATEPTRVLYLTEEGAHTFTRKAARFGVQAGDRDFRYIRRGQPGVSGLVWEEIAAGLAEEAAETGAELVVVDVLHRWAGFDAEGENRSGVVSRAIGLLDPLSEAGVASLILHHAPWGEQRARGSTDLHGAVDQVYYLDRDEGARSIVNLGGRYEPDDRVAYHLDEEAGELVYDGSQTASHAGRTRQAVAFLREAGRPATTREVAEGLDWSESKAFRWLSRAHLFHMARREVGPRGEYLWRPSSALDALGDDGGEGEGEGAGGATG